VLNAKQNEREAEIVAGAGQPGAITIATNMAGRGTDIKLGRRRHRAAAERVKDLDGNEVDVVETAACTSSARSDTSRGASTGSCAGAPVARATRARRSSSCRSKTT
jgi:hypothetical protein